jgi:hypothetical protein
VPEAASHSADSLPASLTFLSFAVVSIHIEHPGCNGFGDPLDHSLQKHRVDYADPLDIIPHSKPIYITVGLFVGVQMGIELDHEVFDVGTISIWGKVTHHRPYPVATGTPLLKKICL